jgi:hypothetical protein
MSNTLDDRRRLILARRMATRKRPGPPCVACKTRRTKCSKFRPCHRCLTLRIDHCVDEGANTATKSIRIQIYNETELATHVATSSNESWLVSDVRMNTFRRCGVHTAALGFRPSNAFDTKKVCMIGLCMRRVDTEPGRLQIKVKPPAAAAVLNRPGASKQTAAFSEVR